MKHTTLLRLLALSVTSYAFLIPHISFCASSGEDLEEVGEPSDTFKDMSEAEIKAVTEAYDKATYPWAFPERQQEEKTSLEPIMPELEEEAISEGWTDVESPVPTPGRGILIPMNRSEYAEKAASSATGWLSGWANRFINAAGNVVRPATKAAAEVNARFIDAGQRVARLMDPREEAVQTIMRGRFFTMKPEIADFLKSLVSPYDPDIISNDEVMRMIGLLRGRYIQYLTNNKDLTDEELKNPERYLKGGLIAALRKKIDDKLKKAQPTPEFDEEELEFPSTAEEEEAAVATKPIEPLLRSRP